MRELGDVGGAAHPDGATAHTGGASTAAPGPHNEADVAFVQHMIPHHAQAIDMSDIVLSKQDVDPDVTELAAKIQTAQGPEIETMRSWLTAWDSRCATPPAERTTRCTTARGRGPA